MEYRIRPARAEDKPAIAGFTQDTFSWGDYVIDAFDKWLIDPAGILLVAVDDEDDAIALGRGTMLSPTELWLQGARVHPDWRRRGIASALDHEMEDWARQRGGRISRLAIEDWNAPAQKQVEKIGLRAVSTWIHARRDVRTEAPVASGNGGRRRPPQDRLVRAPSAEAQPAFMAWSAGPLGRRARGLLAIGWTWRRLSVDDLTRGAKGGALWMCPAGWVLAAPHNDVLELGWLETGPDDVGELLKSALDLAGELGAARLSLKAPALPWLTSELDRTGFDTGEIRIYERPL
ncbi:MAG TPA: GNAT family N-acetyltransferase [Acidimicrobiia bacterium]|jgi:GNAT superfamily N-acetyltransferase|nr:GNAT family N-acetyltransferase [Acidimicrobiia bacterium]